MDSGCMIYFAMTVIVKLTFHNKMWVYINYECQVSKET
jgi:hypothetical protein